MRPLFVVLALCVSGTPSVAWIADYRGTLGSTPIGLALHYESANYSLDPKDFKFSAAHYFYVKHLKNIDLRITRHVGRTLLLEELNAGGVPVAELRLEWPQKDPRGIVGAHFGAPPKNILGEVVTGTWRSLQTQQTLPFYVVQSDIVTGSEGGRCGLNAAEYRRVEQRVADFHSAFIRGDLRYLKKAYGWAPPKTKDVRKEMARAVPHDLFCKDTGFMLGDGAVWFDERGNIMR